MNLRQIISAGSLLTLFMSGGVNQAHAQFASFSGGDFSVAKSGNVTAVSTPVTFQFQTGPLDGHFIPAVLTLSATDSGGLSSSGGVVVEDLKNLTASFTADTPISGHTNLLTFSETGPFMGLDSVTFTPKPWNVAISDTGGFQFTSDFFTFGGNDAYSIMFVTNTKPTVSGTSLTSPISGVAGNGGFYADIVTPKGIAVPEPGPVSLLMGIAVTGSGFAVRRMRRRAT
jgi:hypothetical protein